MWYQFCFCCLSGILSMRNFLVPGWTTDTRVGVWSPLTSVWFNILMRDHSCLCSFRHMPHSLLSLWRVTIYQQVYHEPLRRECSWMNEVWSWACVNETPADEHTPSFPVRGGRQWTSLKRGKRKEKSEWMKHSSMFLCGYFSLSLYKVPLTINDLLFSCFVLVFLYRCVLITALVVNF